MNRRSVDFLLASSREWQREQLPASHVVGRDPTPGWGLGLVPVSARHRRSAHFPKPRKRPTPRRRLPNAATRPPLPRRSGVFLRKRIILSLFSIRTRGRHSWCVDVFVKMNLGFFIFSAGVRSLVGVEVLSRPVGITLGWEHLTFASRPSVSAVLNGFVFCVTALFQNQQTVVFLL